METNSMTDAHGTAGRGAHATRIREAAELSGCDTLIAKYVAASLSQNTLRAYQCDLHHFSAWGGTVPATPLMVARYLATYADTLSAATLSRRITAIARAHIAIGCASPTSEELVVATLRGIRRAHGTAQRQVSALQGKDLRRIVVTLSGVRGIRDKALLLVGFGAALRRSELVSLDVSDVAFVAEGAIIRLRQSKTDQEWHGRDIAIPSIHCRHCPCRALHAWLQTSKIESGALFRRVNRYGEVLPGRLSSQSVALIVKQRVMDAGLNPTTFSGHSLRAGFATSAAKAGASSTSIRAQTGHQSDAMLQRYIRDSQLFAGNANRDVWR